MHYLSYLTHFTNPKNKLQKAALKFLKDKDRHLITSDSQEGFRGMMEAELERINAENPRCKKLSYEWYKHQDEDWRLFVRDLATFVLLQSKN